MDNATFQRIKDLILNNQEIGVIVRPNPTLDEMAAGLGMFLSLKLLNKNVSIACPTDPVVALSSLIGIDKVQKSLSSGGEGGDLTVTFPYQEGEIEKVSYTLDNGKLNIVVKAGEKGLSFAKNDVEFIRSGTGNSPTLVFFIGIPHLSDVAHVVQPVAGQTTVVNIDNKPENEKYGDVAIVDTKWSSVSEQVADFVTLLEPQIELDADTAQNLLTGINVATQDFTSPKTSYLAFEVAGILMKKGATRQRALEIAQGAQSTGMNSQQMNTYFPPVQQQSPKPQPVVQPAWQPQPYVPQQPKPVMPSMPQPFTPAPIQQTPVNPAWQPQPYVPQQPVQQSAPVQQLQQPEQKKEDNKQAPPDWLTPKVYKGSTIL
jgi:hypothetical protein